MKWKATDYEAVSGPLRYSVWPLKNNRWAFGIEFIPDEALIFTSADFASRREAMAAAEKLAKGEAR